MESIQSMVEGGTSCLLLVEGPSGTGKSHLLSAVAAEVRQKGFRVQRL
ncbi:hypothetical protein ABT072_44020 [Streptomyces sp. NPDC002589]